MRFRSDPATIRGSTAPVVSPFTADGAPDTGGPRALIRWQLGSAMPDGRVGRMADGRVRSGE
jgi:hypothetical protein